MFFFSLFLLTTFLSAFAHAIGASVGWARAAGKSCTSDAIEPSAFEDQFV